MLKKIKLNLFVRDESGAVTPDWVVLTGAIVGLGLVMLNAVGKGADDLADAAATSYSTPRVTLAYATADEGGLSGTGDVVTNVVDTTTDLTGGTGEVVAY